MRHLSLIVTDACSTDGDMDPGHGHHVLIVDSGAFTARLAKRLLTRAGFMATVIPDARAARAFLTTFDVDALVVGPRELSALDSTLDRVSPPIVVTSGHEIDDETCERAEARGAITVALTGNVVDAVLEALWERPAHFWRV